MDSGSAKDILIYFLVYNKWRFRAARYRYAHFMQVL
jgi:hypothetical protein